MSQFPEEMLHNLMPMHAVLDTTGRIRQAGPTLHKLSEDRLEGARFLDVFEVYRPRAVTGMAQLLLAGGRKLHIRLRKGLRTPLTGILVADGRGGAIVNLSFGIKTVDAVRDYALTSTDFAPTDLAIEMLYLVEAKTAAMESSRSLNTKLQGAMVAAEKRAYTDTLTGLHNRRAMDAVLERQVRSGEPFSVMHMDLDFFKQVNDTLGHGAGDHVLRHVARIMTEETRGDDTVARVGGDEFVIVFPNLTARRRLAELATRIVERIERPIPYDNRSCRISVSIGIVVSDGLHPDPVALIEQADQALYAAKHAGRAQFRFYEGGSDASGKARAR